ncbi:hypothetical protein Pla175_30880 [Pirellulimonas nuda]|uniref:Thioredoxin domain-containing protein n=1 Tax=Pirellulimonas nuda TaxID=2528009 RepID=A0A518DDZ8_9BACT|nr:hypothetical protein [Pirellulimonas nuda]QDU89693.1 hypothetical protein Pla175_30880 [Pirellulimonas nuda]
MQLILPVTLSSLLLAGVAGAQEPLFSGPQVGETLAPFEAQQAFGAAEKVDVLAGTGEAPLLVVFVHQVTRPSIGLTRLLMEYAASKADEGLETRLVFLTDDVTEATAFLSRARHALPKGATPLISTDGVEGPGAYGLNRKMTLTVLVASDGVVTANFPLIQPSVQADGPKIGHAIVQALGGGEAPTLADMGYKEPQMAMGRGRQQAEQDALYRQLMAPVIQKTATPEEVAKAAAAVEDLAAKDPGFRQRVYNASRLISQGPRLDQYGTKEAQQYLKKWAKELAPSDAESDDARQDNKAEQENDAAPDSEAEGAGPHQDQDG